METDLVSVKGSCDIAPSGDDESDDESLLDESEESEELLLEEELVPTESMALISSVSALAVKLTLILFTYCLLNVLKDFHH